MSKRPTRPTPKPTPKPAPVADSDDALLFPEISYPKKRAFLTHFVLCGSRQQAAASVGLEARNHWHWLANDPSYAEAFKRAEIMAGDVAEDKAYQLGLNGYLEGVWHKGEQVGTQVRYLPTLLAMILNAAKPDRYKFRSSIQHDISPALAALQRQWQQAALPPMRPRPDVAPEESIDAEYAEVAPVREDERPPMPGAPTVAEIFEALDRVNHVESMEDEGDVEPEDAPEDATPEPRSTPLRVPGYAWQVWAQQQQRKEP